MNNRFKFKGYWYNDTLKEWRVYDEPEFITGDGSAEIWYNSEGGASPELPPNADLHLCQCTGLKDKNGKLIYEGDILQDIARHDKPLYIVKWNKSQAQFYIEMINPKKYELYAEWHMGRHDLDYEVIGNIYENKELLESEG